MTLEERALERDRRGSPGNHQHSSAGPFRTKGTTKGVDKFQCWSSFAYGFELTGDPFFINKVKEMAGVAKPPEAPCRSTKTKNLENRAALLALVQQLLP